MIILGIDPGLKATGYGLIDSKRSEIKLIETGTIEPNQKKKLEQRLKHVHVALYEMVEQYRPDVIVLEKLYAHSNHPMTASTLGHVRGVICLVAAQLNIELVEQSVKRIRKSITGTGNATKVQTRKVVSHILSIDEKKLKLDASDALALALGHIHLSKRIT